jgi:phosphonate transport system substrate-binding protein
LAFLGLLLLGLQGCAPEAGPLVDLSERGVAPTLTAPPAGSPPVYTFSYDHRLEPTEDAQMYASLLDYLTGHTGFRFRLYVSHDSQDLVSGLESGRIDFAAVGALSYLQAEARDGVRMLAVGRNSEGQSTYRAEIFARPDSPIQHVSDLRGKSFAFGSRTSTQGYLIPLIMMSEAGLRLQDLREYEHTGSHAECVDAVLSGQFDAGALQDTLAERLAAERSIRIVATSAAYPSSGIVAGTGVPPEIAERVRDALLTLDPQGKDGPNLYRWHDSEMPDGFAEARPGEYEALRGWARQLGILDSGGGTQP